MHGLVHSRYARRLTRREPARAQRFVRRFAGLSYRHLCLGANLQCLPTVAKFTPLLTSYLGKLGGPTVQNLLAGALK
jgi:hypothetical protein